MTTLVDPSGMDSSDVQHELFGLVATLDKPLGGFPVIGRVDADLRITQCPDDEQLSSHIEWFMDWHLPCGELWASFGKSNGKYLVRFNGLADFFISGQGSEISWSASANVSLRTIRHLLLDQVMPLVLNVKGRESLHASAVMAGDRVVAFCGPAGVGKSTIAASFVRVGFPLLSDDCLALLPEGGTICAIPAYPGLRLFQDSLAGVFENRVVCEDVSHYSNKRHVNLDREAGEFFGDTRPLKRVYALASPGHTAKSSRLRIEPLSQRDGFMELVRCAFRLDITDRAMLQRQFRFLELVASKVPIRRLAFPRNLDLLPALRQAIVTDLDESLE